MKSVMKTCKKCKTQFALGYNGIWSWKDNAYVCDSCANVTRVEDEYSNHTAYEPGEPIPAGAHIKP